MTNKYNNWIYRSIDIGLAVNGNGNIEIAEKDGESGEEYGLSFHIGTDTKEEIIQRIGEEVFSWLSLMFDEIEEDVEE